ENCDFLSARPLHRVRIATFWVMGHSAACEPQLSERWATPPRANHDFLSAGLFHRVRIATVKVHRLSPSLRNYYKTSASLLFAYLRESLLIERYIGQHNYSTIFYKL